MRQALAVLFLLAGLLAAVVGGTSAAVLGTFALTGLGILLALWPLKQEAPAPIAVPGTPLPAPEPDLVAAFGDPVLIVDDGRIEQANAAARKLLGAHIVGEDVRVAIRHPAAADRLTSRQEPDPRPIDLAGVGGRDNRWQMNVARLGDGRTLVHLVDRSEGHAAERMRVDFVANASHELRTPLAAIIGYVETLDDETAGGDVPTRKRFLRIIHDEARRMQRLVEDLMSLSRIEAEKFRAPSDAVDLNELVKEVQAVIRDGTNERSRDVTVDLDESLPAIAGDRAQLSQLLHNLVGNAMKYGRAGTPVSIHTGRGPGSMVRLSVEDEGEGIAPEHLPRLTERFYRVDPSRSRAQGGTGLGLAIVKHIVERHRGRLDIQSTPGKGTIVTALLPPAARTLSQNRNAAVTEAKPTAS